MSQSTSHDMTLYTCKKNKRRAEGHLLNGGMAMRSPALRILLATFFARCTPRMQLRRATNTTGYMQAMGSLFVPLVDYCSTPRKDHTARKDCENVILAAVASVQAWQGVKPTHTCQMTVRTLKNESVISVLMAGSDTGAGAREP